MPQSINVNGTTTYRPGVYSKIDTSALAGRSLEINRVAVVGHFPFLKKDTPKEFVNPRSMTEFEISSNELKEVALFLYNGNNDPRVAGGPSSVTLVNATTSTQAQYVLSDVGTFKSKAYGTVGNRLLVSGKVNADTATQVDLTFSRDGISEEIIGFNEGTILKIVYGGAVVDGACSLTFGPETGIEVTQVFKLTGDGAGGFENYAGSGAAFSGGNLSYSCGDGDAGSANEQLTVTVVGVKADGTAGNEQQTLVLTAGGTLAATDSTSAWSSISSITVASNDNTSDTVLNISTKAFDLTPAQTPTLADIVAYINAQSGTHKYTATLSSPKFAKVKTSLIDEGTVADLTIADPAGVSADIQLLIDEINAKSTLVEFTRATINEGSNSGLVSFLTKFTANPLAETCSGGTQSAAPAIADFKSAFALLDRSRNIQIIIPISTDLEVAKAVRDHCKHMAGTGQSECNAWCAVAAGRTTDQLKTDCATINSRHVALVGQGVVINDWAGRQRTYEPWALALMCAGIQAGTGISEPVTFKRPNLLSTTENGWNPNRDADLVVRNGLCVVTSDRLGPRVERSVTTYLEDDNPVFSEVSANESLNTCIRDLRGYVEGFLGGMNTTGIKNLVRAIAASRLREQVSDNIIKAFDNDTLDVVDLGDRLRIDVRISVVEPLNFIVISAEVVRDI